MVKKERVIIMILVIYPVIIPGNPHSVKPEAKPALKKSENLPA